MKMNRNIASLLSKPDFTNLSEFWERVEELPRVEKVPLHLPSGEEVPNAYSIVDEGTNLVNGIVSDRYEIVQYQEVFEPILRGIQETGLEFTGTFRAVESSHGAPFSRAVATVFFESPRFRHDLRTGETLALGINIWAGQDGKTGVGMSASGCNLVCTNGNIVSDFMGEARVKHVGNPSKAFHAFQNFTEQMLVEAMQLPGIYNVASMIPVQPDDVAPMLLGAGFGKRSVSEIVDNYDRYLVGVQKDQGLTILNTFNASTYWATHVYDKSVESAEQYLSKANRILREPHDCINRGRRILEELTAKATA